MSACFQEGGRQPSRYEQFRISMTGTVSRSAFSFNSQAGMPSGPKALVGFSAVNFLKTEKAETTSGEDRGASGLIVRMLYH